MKHYIATPTLCILLILTACCNRTAEPPNSWLKVERPYELLKEVATACGATVKSETSSADIGGHQMNSGGGAWFSALSYYVELNGADHHELVAEYIKRLKKDAKSNGCEIGSHGPTNQSKQKLNQDYFFSYTMQGGNVAIGEIRLWSTRMANDKIRITLVNLDYP